MLTYSFDNVSLKDRTKELFKAYVRPYLIGGIVPFVLGVFLLVGSYITKDKSVISMGVSCLVIAEICYVNIGAASYVFRYLNQSYDWCFSSAKGKEMTLEQAGEIFTVTGVGFEYKKIFNENDIKNLCIMQHIIVVKLKRWQTVIFPKQDDILQILKEAEKA